MATFWEKYKHPKWQKRRLEILGLAGFECECCGSTEKTLNVHHKLYRKGADPWDYSDDELQCLCEDCHESEHAIRQRLNEWLARISIGELEMVMGYAAGQWLYGSPDREIQVTSAEMAMGVAAVFKVTDDQVIDRQIQHKKITHDLLWEINHPDAYKD